MSTSKHLDGYQRFLLILLGMIVLKNLPTEVLMSLLGLGAVVTVVGIVAVTVTALRALQSADAASKALPPGEDD